MKITIEVDTDRMTEENAPEELRKFAEDVENASRIILGRAVTITGIWADKDAGYADIRRIADEIEHDIKYRHR